MKSILKIISYLGLALTLIPSFLVFTGAIEFESNKILMFVGTLLWFSTVPFWMKQQS